MITRTSSCNFSILTWKSSIGFRGDGKLIMERRALKELYQLQSLDVYKTDSIIGIGFIHKSLQVFVTLDGRYLFDVTIPSE